MAKKKRRITEEPDEEYEFTPTEFNEREFVLRDIYTSKVFFVDMVFAIVIGIIGAVLISYYPMRSGNWNLMSIIVTVIVFAMIPVMKKVTEKMGLHPELMDVKALAGNYFMYLAMALVVCIILIQVL